MPKKFLTAHYQINKYLIYFNEVIVIFYSTDLQIFEWLSKAQPDAVAVIAGSPQYSQISGTVKFYQTDIGVFVVTSVTGLPKNSDPCAQPIFAFHIHNGSGCTSSSSVPFENSCTHFNPNNCSHPFHAGDMPPLFSSDGAAWNTYFTNRFRVNNIIGLPVIIHSKADDFTTQPSGNSGDKIACGVINEI